MKSHTSLLTRLLSFSRLRRGAPERVLVHPMREWITCLIIGFFIGIALFGFAGFDFYTQMTVVDTVTASDVSIPKYRAADADSIIRYYDGKEAQFKTVRKAGVSIAPATISVGAEEVISSGGETALSLPEVADETESQ